MKKLITLLLMVMQIHAYAMDMKKISIYITVDNSITEDSLVCQSWDHFLDLTSTNSIPFQKQRQASQNAAFIINPPSDTQGIYLSIKGKKINYLSTYLAEPGDNISISINKSNITFSGTGAAKYECRYQMEKAMQEWAVNVLNNRTKSVIQAGVPMQFAYPQNIAEAGPYWQERNKIGLEILDRYKDKITDWSYQVIRADLIGQAEMEKLRGLVFFTTNFSPTFSQITKDSLCQLMLENYKKTVDTKHNVPEYIQSFSAAYHNFLTDYAYRAIQLEQQNGFDWIKENFNGEQKEKLITSLILRSINKIPDNLGIELVQNLKIPVWKEIAESAVSHQSKGAKAYPFVLPDSKGKMISLNDLKGKAIMLDFWFTGCSGCVDLASKMHQITDRFKNNPNIIFASISLDRDAETWKKSLASKKYTGEGYLNMYTEGHGFDHPFIKYYQVQACPKTLIIGSKGNIVSNCKPDFSSKESIESYCKLLEEAIK